MQVLHVPILRSDFKVGLAHEGVLKYATTMLGALCVMIFGAMLMHKLRVDNSVFLQQVSYSY